MLRELTGILVLFDLVVDQTATEHMCSGCLFILFQNDTQKIFDLKDAFDSIQCLIRVCYKTFKEYREYVLKRHFVCYHFNINKLNYIY